MLMKQKSRKNVCLKDLNLINIEKFLPPPPSPPNKTITLENEMEEKKSNMCISCWKIDTARLQFLV